eukprot:1803587-Rhodomonas_salina.1
MPWTLASTFCHANSILPLDVSTLISFVATFFSTDPDGAACDDGAKAGADACGADTDVFDGDDADVSGTTLGADADAGGEERG